MEPTAALAPGFVQANLVVLPAGLADAFDAFCRLNPAPLPLLERLARGSPCPIQCASDADVRMDVPKYRIFESGVLLREVTDLGAEWMDDSTAFLLGCSFTFDSLLRRAGIPVRHLEQQCNVPMYRTDRDLTPSEPFSGNLVVSMRPIPEDDIDRAIEITRPWTMAHGAPIHVGDPRRIGILDLARPQYGDPVHLHPGDVPVFWACGVSSHQAAVSGRIRSMITHAPGYMFITDLRLDEQLKGG